MIETGSGRILAMDDEATIRSLYQLMLPQLGYDTVCARDGQEAIQVLAAESAAGRPFDAVIVDLTVSGGMGGLETLAEIRKLDASIPVFLASGYAGGPVIPDPDAWGFSGGIGKPFTLAELAGLLRAVSNGAGGGCAIPSAGYRPG